MKIEITSQIKITDFNPIDLPQWRGYLTVGNKKYFLEHNNAFFAPRGFIEYLTKRGLPPLAELVDKTNEAPLPFTTAIKIDRRPYDYQEEAVEDLSQYNLAGLKSPTGSGKTNIACYLIAKKQVKTLIIVPTTDLVKQTVSRVKEVLVIDDKNIGIYSGAKKEIKPITIGTWQSITNNIIAFRSEFGMVIADEYHGLAYNYFLIMHSINSRYKYGISATPKRPQDDNRLLQLAVGSIKHEVDIERLYKAGKLIRPVVNIINTGIKLKEWEMFTTGQLKILNTNQKLGIFKNKISKNHGRNAFILNYIKMKAYNSSLVLAYQREHCEKLYHNYPGDNKVFIHGGLTKTKKKEIFSMIDKYKELIIFGTQSLLGTGVDIPKLENLFIVSPFAGENKTIQFAGRVMRKDFNNPNKRVNIYDFHDEWIRSDIGQKNRINPHEWINKRLVSYKKIGAIIF